MIKYETTCPECMLQSYKLGSGRIRVSPMTGAITDADFVEATCQQGHTIKIFPREGKYTFILAHAFKAFQAGQLYEAASSGYAALEDFMKLYIQASAWVSTGQPKDAKALYDRVRSNNLLMGNSTRIIGAYAYLYQMNTGSIIQQSKFEKMSHIRDSIIHAVRLPKVIDTDKLLVAIYRHISIASIRWSRHPKAGEKILQPWLPDYKIQLALATLKASGMVSVDAQGIINQLSQATTLLFPDMLFFDDRDALNAEIKNVSTSHEDASAIAEQMPKLQA